MLETGRRRIVGDLHLPREGYRSRLSDYLNHGDIDFIPLANATISPIDAEGPAEHARLHRGRPHPHSPRLPGERRTAPKPRVSARLGDPVAERDVAVRAQQDHARSSLTAPITRHSDMNGPICFGGKLTTATTSVPSSSPRS